MSQLTQSDFKLEFDSDGGYIKRGQKNIRFSKVGGVFRLTAMPTHAMVAPVEAMETTHDGQQGESAPLAAAAASSAETGETQEAETARKQREPKAPSKAEQDLHGLTRVPYCSWRQACVRGRGRNNHHKARDKTKARAGEPLIQLDHVLSHGNQGLAALSVVDVETGYGGSTLITKKGGTDRYAVAFCLSELSELGYADAILQTQRREQHHGFG